MLFSFSHNNQGGFRRQKLLTLRGSARQKNAFFLSIFFKKCPKTAFFNCFFFCQKSACGTKNFARLPSFQCFRRARKINFVDSKKKSSKFLKFFENPPPPPPPPPRENPRSAPDKNVKLKLVILLSR